MKDKVDIISLLEFADIRRDTFERVLRDYDRRHMLRDAIGRVISESRIEYKFLGLAHEKDGVQLKRSFENL